MLGNADLLSGVSHDLVGMQRISFWESNLHICCCVGTRFGLRIGSLGASGSLNVSAFRETGFQCRESL
jgi:hypothetical protein